jgi:uncharacterized protein (TIGR02300 family)
MAQRWIFPRLLLTVWAARARQDRGGFVEIRSVSDGQTAEINSSALGGDKTRNQTVTKAERGEKHRCLSCNTAFYDLNLAPIVCPKCAEIFHVVEPIRSSRRRGDTFPSGGRWPPPPCEASPNEMISESDGENVDGEVAPASSDHESSESDLIEEIA